MLEKTSLTVKNTYTILYYLGTTLSLAIGILHFFVPWAFEWFSYISPEYENLIVSINWVNLCFSFMLTGLSLLAILWRKKVLSGCAEAVVMYGFLTSLWIFRIVIDIVFPLPANSPKAVAYGQLVGAVIITALLAIPLIKVLMSKNNTRKEK